MFNDNEIQWVYHVQYLYNFSTAWNFGNAPKRQSFRTVVMWSFQINHACVVKLNFKPGNLMILHFNVADAAIWWKRHVFTIQKSRSCNMCLFTSNLFYSIHLTTFLSGHKFLVQETKHIFNNYLLAFIFQASCVSILVH